jgi:hypothetical protein
MYGLARSRWARSSAPVHPYASWGSVPAETKLAADPGKDGPRLPCRYPVDPLDSDQRRSLWGQRRRAGGSNLPGTSGG